MVRRGIDGKRHTLNRRYIDDFVDAMEKGREFTCQTIMHWIIANKGTRYAPSVYEIAQQLNARKDVIRHPQREPYYEKL